MRLTSWLFAILAAGSIAPAVAAQQDGDDPPSRVARISYLGGSVSFRPATVDDWTTATLNYPLTTGDHLWADDGARVELQIGSSAIRLGSQTAFSVLALDDHRAQFRLAQGELEVRVRALDDDDNFEIDTPDGAITLLRPGTYRVDVDTAGQSTTITVRHGDAQVTASGSSFAVKPGQSAIVSGQDNPTYDLAAANPPDDWEDWCSARDRRWDDAVSARYVSREMIGYEDLDGYGQWRVVAGYGPVWVPTTVVVGWAPYRYGHWAWVEPWGWTWIDDAPWGFAPFHYGRWAYIGGGWAWVPGPVVVRPVYAPALVAFVGGGPGWRLSVSIGSGVAWFPLAPGEPYVPAYRASNVYIRNVNVTNVHVTNINVTNINYANRDVPGAVTVVSRTVFTGARPVGPAAIAVRPRDLAGARVLGGAPAVAPQRVSVLARASAVGPVRRPPMAVMNRQVVVRTTPPAAPVPFAQQRRALDAHPGHSIAPAEAAQFRSADRPVQGASNGGASNGGSNADRPAYRPAGGAPDQHGGLRPARSGLPPVQRAEISPAPANRAPPTRVRHEPNARPPRPVMDHPSSNPGGEAQAPRTADTRVERTPNDEEHHPAHKEAAPRQRQRRDSSPNDRPRGR